LLFTGGFCQAENLIAIFEYDIQLAGLQKQHVRLLTLSNPPRTAPPPHEQCPAPFLGLTVQPCGESCGFVVGLDFLTEGFIQIEKKSNFTQPLNLCQWLVPCFRKMLNRPKEMNASGTKVPLADP